MTEQEIQDTIRQIVDFGGAERWTGYDADDETFYTSIYNNRSNSNEDFMRDWAMDKSIDLEKAFQKFEVICTDTDNDSASWTLKQRP